MKHNSPFPYQGGKHKECKIFDTFLRRDISICEPFFGSGTVTNFFGKKNSCLVSEKMLDVYLIWKFVKEKNAIFFDNVINLCQDINNNEDFYYRKRDEFNAFYLKGDINEERSAIFYYLICTCHASMIRFGPRGFNTSFFQKGNNFRRYNIHQKIKVACNTADKILSLSNVDALCVLKNKLSVDLIYCDPPYINSDSIYEGDWSRDNYLELIELLRFQNGKGVPSLTSNYSDEHFDSKFDNVLKFEINRNANAGKRVTKNNSNILGKIGNIPEVNTLEGFMQ